MNVDVVTRGPLFTGAAPRIIAAMMNDITEAVAEEGADQVRAGTGVFKNPTGRWESEIKVSAFASGHRVDVGLIYDRWLEGVSRRNQTTRFKGYRTFQNAMSRLLRTVRPIAERAAAPHVRRLG